eukprot:1122138-Pyramimonas_sp.AAC.1
MGARKKGGQGEGVGPEMRRSVCDKGLDDVFQETSWNMKACFRKAYHVRGPCPIEMKERIREERNANQTRRGRTRTASRE